MRLYEDLGCQLREISLPHTEYAIATYYLVATAEASSNLARYDGVRYGLREGGTSSLQEMYRKTRHIGFGKEVKRRILLGTYALSAGYYDAYYLKALKVRTLILRDFQKAFELLMSFWHRRRPRLLSNWEKTGDPLSMYLSDIFRSRSLLRHPCHFGAVRQNSEGLPIGMQLMANHFREGLLMTLAHHFEKAGGFSV